MSEVLACLKKYGQRLDLEIAKEMGMPLATVRQRLAGLAVAGYYVLANQLVLVVGLVLILLALAAALRGIVLGYRPAIVFLAAELSLMIGIAVAISRSMGLIPASAGSEYALQAGYAIEVLLFSDRIDEWVVSSLHEFDGWASRLRVDFGAAPANFVPIK